MSEYYGTVNQELLAYMALSANRALEVGCGEGALAGAYKLRNPRAHYTGVEIYAPAAEIARSRLDRLFVCAFEDVSNEELLSGGLFDLIVMGDVLEHLVDPWAALRRIHDLLAPGGSFAICVPNIGHWSSMAEIIQGRWTYRDSGLFDRTHLRWFTRQSLLDVLRDSNLQTMKLRGRRELVDPGMAKQWMPVLGNAAASIGEDRDDFIERASMLQYVAAARKPMSADPAPTLEVSFNALGPKSSRFGAHLPVSAMNTLPDISIAYHEGNLTLVGEKRNMPRIAILHRLRVTGRQQYLQSLGRAIASGWIIVADEGRHASTTEFGQEVGGAGAPLTITAAHAVQTSSLDSWEAFSEHNPETAVFPTSVLTLAPFMEHDAGPQRVFVGAVDSVESTVEIAEALQPTITAHPEAEFWVVSDRGFYDALPTSRKRFQPSLPYDRYVEAMARCQILLLPGASRKDDQSRMELNYLEASARGLATIASSLNASCVMTHGQTALTAAGVAEWPQHLMRLLGESSKRTEIARAAWNYVRAERMLANQAAARRDWMWSLWHRRRELTAALFERHPEIAFAAKTARTSRVG